MAQRQASCSSTRAGSAQHCLTHQPRCLTGSCARPAAVRAPRSAAQRAAEAEAGAGSPAAESTGVPAQLLDSLASLSDWAHGGDGPRDKQTAPGGHQLGLIPRDLQHRHCLKGAKEAPDVSMVRKLETDEHGPTGRGILLACAGPSRMGAGPASFPVALSDGSMTSMSRLSSVSPVKQRRARHPRLPASAPIRGPYRLGDPPLGVLRQRRRGHCGLGVPSDSAAQLCECQGQRGFRLATEKRRAGGALHAWRNRIWRLCQHYCGHEQATAPSI